MVFSCVVGPLVYIRGMHAVCKCTAADWNLCWDQTNISGTGAPTARKTLIVTGHIIAKLAVASVCTPPMSSNAVLMRSS